MLLFVSLENYAQDKVFLRNGKVIPCKIVAISENTISYKDTTENSSLATISKNDVLLTEYGTGTIYMFGKEPPVISIGNNSAPISTMPEMSETRKNNVKHVK